jgi:hypothetical protein
MYWAALSTDIKKSSVNWSGLPQWMQNAVQYHNRIIETVVKTYKKYHNPHNVVCELLPNAPEGDAFTYIFNHTSMDELKEFVILLGTDMQHVFETLRTIDKKNEEVWNLLGLPQQMHPIQLRRKIMLKNDDLIGELRKQDGEKKEKFETYNRFQKEEYFGGIFIRIGVAFSEEAPIPYKFKRYRGPNNTINKVSKSYRSGVICSAEKAEERADYKPISRLEGETVKVSPVIKECYVENGERKFKDRFGEDGDKIQKANVANENKPNPTTRRHSIRRGSVGGILTTVPKLRRIDILTEVIVALKKNPETPNNVNGFCVFVEYERALKDKRVMKSPHLKTLIEQEYTDVHDKANRVVEKFLDSNSEFRGGLVKQKRDSTSMFVIIANTERQASTLTAPSQELYEEFSKLVSSLPIGSCVGFAYGKMKEITMKRDEEGTFTDYFEDCVNLAARMAMRDWSYTTEWGMVGENEHHNRVAFTSKFPKSEMTKLISYVENRLEVANVPFTYDHVPLSALNAGDDTSIACISTQFIGWERLRIGDTVEHGNNKYEIIGDYGDFFKLVGKKGLVPREQLTKVHIKPFDKEEFRKFKLKL